MKAMHKIGEMLIKAEDLIDTRPQEAFFAASATLEKMAHVINHLDDSNGEGSGVIHHALGLLAAVWHSDLSAALEAEVFDFVWSAVTKGMFQGWSDYEDELIALMMGASHSPERSDKVLHLLDVKFNEACQKKVDVFQDYTVENILRQKINFLKQLDRESEARELMLQNLHYDRLRREYVVELLIREDYTLAKAIISEGITIAEQKDHPGTVNQWRETLLEIARREKNTVDIRAFTKRLFHDSHQSMEYYRQYKTTFSEQERSIERSVFLRGQEQLFEEQKKNRLGVPFPQKLAELYAEENMWEKVFGLLTQFPDLSRLDFYEKQFTKTHAAEYLEMYAQAIEKRAEQASDRTRYRELADYLKKIRQFEGGIEVVNRLVATFRSKYAKRWAMIEELNGF